MDSDEKRFGIGFVLKVAFGLLAFLLLVLITYSILDEAFNAYSNQERAQALSMVHIFLVPLWVVLITFCAVRIWPFIRFLRKYRADHPMPRCRTCNKMLVGPDQLFDWEQKLFCAECYQIVSTSLIRSG